MASIGDLKVLIGANIDPLLKNLKQAEKNIQMTARNMQAVGDSMLKLTAPILGVATVGFKMAADFDDSMRKVQAVSGATGDQFDQLRAKALEMGRDTKFTAVESAAAMNYMGMAGWNTQQIMSGLPGVLNLAAASGEDLALVSDIVTDGMTAFGLAADQSGRFADVLAAASSAANTNVAMMGDTFRYVAPVAGALGFSIEDTALAIGLMANAGIKGSQAGTALRSMISRMVKPVGDSAKAMQELGLSVTDADGKMKPMNQLLIELRDKFSQLTPAQQAQMAASIAGQEAMSGMLALVGASDADFDKLSESIANSSGRAQEMADIMEGGAGGGLRRMRSALESAAITLGDAFAPMVEKVVDKVTELANWFTSLDRETKENILQWTAWVAGLGAAFKIVGMLIGGIAGLVNVTAQLKMIQLQYAFAVEKTNKFLKANTMMVYMAGAIALYYALRKLNDAFTSVSAEYKISNDLKNIAEKETLKEKNRVEQLTKVLGNNLVAQDQRIAALKELQQISPKYFGGLELEKLKIEDVTKAKNAYIESLLRSAKAQAAESMLVEQQSKLMDAQMKLAEDIQKVNEGKHPLTMHLSKDRAKEIIRDSYASFATDIYKAINHLQSEIEKNPIQLPPIGEGGPGQADPGAVDDLSQKASKTITQGVEKGAKDAEKKVVPALQEIGRSIFSKMFDGKIDFKPQEAEGEKSIKSINPENNLAPIDKLIQSGTEKLKEFNSTLQKVGENVGPVTQKIGKGFAQAASDIANSILDFADKWAPVIGQLQATLGAYFDFKNTKIEEGYEREKAVIEGSKMSEEAKQQALLALDKKTDAERRKIQRQQAIANKAMAIFDATINVASGITKALTMGPLGLIMAKLIAGLGAAQIGLIAGTPIPKLAKGGLAYGPTMAMVGDNPGANVDPEVISPLSKLKDMINSQVTVNLAGEFRMSGRDLWLVVDKENQIQKRLKGV